MNARVPAILANGRKCLRPRASALVTTVILMTVAGTAAASWILYVNHATAAAVRDRQRLDSFYAAEAGVERIVDFFNNPVNFTGAEPEAYTDELATQPAAITLAHRVAPEHYALFEPYIVTYETNSSGQPVNSEGAEILDSDGILLSGEFPVVRRWTHLTDPSDRHSSKVPTCELNAADLPNTILRDAQGRELARVVAIKLIHPSDFEDFGGAPAPPGDKVVCKVISTAESKAGIRTTVESVLIENPSINLASPGAILTEATTTFDGQFNVHWGDVWAKEDIVLPNNFWRNGTGAISRETADPWMRIRTEQNLLYRETQQYHVDGRIDGGFGTTPIAAGSPNYYLPFLETSLHSRNRASFAGYENLQQHQNLEWPDYDYESWKTLFLTAGLPYYFAGPDGSVFGVDRELGSDTYGQLVGRTYDEWFAVSPDDPDYFDTEKCLAFIDTIPTDESGNYALDENGIPVRNATYKSRAPFEDGANMATIAQAGAGIHTRGAILVANNLEFRGQGNPPDSDTILDPEGNPYVTDPDGDEPRHSFDVNHNGLLLSWGTVTNTGNRTVYGSIHALRGFAGSGSREVYYNYRLRDGSWLNLNQSRLRRQLWAITADNGTPIG